MPRTGRVVIPDYPHHVVQRGHNRRDVFYSTADFRNYLGNMLDLKRRFEIRVHAWCLMSNHVHLLLTPHATAGGLASFMKSLAGRTTRYRNRLDGRSGTLWESRYRSSPVQNDRYLLACSRYIELNPVRAGMVSRPEAYRWSSYRERMGMVKPDLLDPDPCYLMLGRTDRNRRARYQKLAEEGLVDDEIQLIRNSLQRGQLTGDDELMQMVTEATGRTVPSRGPGRPYKHNSKQGTVEKGTDLFFAGSRSSRPPVGQE